MAETNRSPWPQPFWHLTYLMGMATQAIIDDLTIMGFANVSAALDAQQVERISRPLADLVGAGHALRHVHLKAPAVVSELRAALMPMLAPILGDQPLVCDATLFRKPPKRNWQVPWHQDLLLAANAKADAPGWQQWSIKEGVWHVQPPPELLARLLAVRVHLSDCGPNDGPLRLLPGSHRQGILPAGGLADQGRPGEEYVCTASAGDLLLMRPLTLHASRIAHGRSDRMIVHVVLGAAVDVAGSPLATIGSRRFHAPENAVDAITKYQ